MLICDSGVASTVRIQILQNKRGKVCLGKWRFLTFTENFFHSMQVALSRVAQKNSKIFGDAKKKDTFLSKQEGYTTPKIRATHQRHGMITRQATWHPL